MKTFWNKCQLPDAEACWPYRRCRSKSGYGRFCDVAGKVWQAHRLAWTLTYGPIPPGLLVCHKCDVRACCNPGHMFLGSHRDNSADMVTKGRSHKGEKSIRARLTERQVLQLRTTVGKTQRELAAEFGISQTAVYRILHKLRWSHI